MSAVSQGEGGRVHILGKKRKRDRPPEEKPPSDGPPPSRPDATEALQEFEAAPSLYEQGSTGKYTHFRVRRFLRRLLDELDKPFEFASRERMLGDPIQTDDVEWGGLFVYPDESIIFAGRDPTARDAPPEFGFVIEPFSPIPAPTDPQAAIDLLKPKAVQNALAGDRPPARQGEWWLLPTKSQPVGSVFRPGVQSRPFGPSPLGNHIPTQWGLGVPDDVFMERFHERVGRDMRRRISRPDEAVEWLHKQRFFDSSPDVFIPAHVPDWDELWEMAGSIYVKGTLRHRENDHYVETIGDEWHEAITHDFDVYTGDGLDMPLSID